MFDDDPMPPDQRFCDGCGRKASHRKALFYKGFLGARTLCGRFGRVCWRNAKRKLEDAELQVCE